MTHIPESRGIELAFPVDLSRETNTISSQITIGLVKIRTATYDHPIPQSCTQPYQLRPVCFLPQSKNADQKRVPQSLESFCKSIVFSEKAH